MRERIHRSLNGLWDYRIGQGAWETVRVPYSRLCVGHSECARTFQAEPREKGWKRAFLVIEGLTYAAEISLNGAALGSLLAYEEGRFEITGSLREGPNRVLVEIEDISPVFGPSEGWENYGGICRDVWVEYTSEAIVRDVVWLPEIGSVNRDGVAAFAPCEAGIQVSCENAERFAVRCMLRDALGETVADASAEVKSGEAKIRMALPEARLWSPDDPCLYTLETELLDDQENLCDCRRERVGFSQLTASSRRFLLNGSPLFLQGVCRHETWGEQGHALTLAQLRQDLCQIKAAGCNFVRLVHYPACRRTVELADEIGLLVSEEPGLWWSDMHNQELCGAALRVLGATVRRDRNHPSIAFWLSFNECIFTPEYLLASAKVCRENDSRHLVSGANCMDVPTTRELYARCGFDFYTMHPYSETPDRFDAVCREFHDKPLLFTEWGGHFVYDNPKLFREFIRKSIELWRQDDDSPRGVLAGASYWMWNGMYEWSRAEPACVKGILCEGLVTENREPNLCLPVFIEAYRELAEERGVFTAFRDVCPFRGDGVFLPLSLGVSQSEENLAAFREAVRDANLPIPKYFYDMKKLRKITVGPSLPATASRLGSLPVQLENTPAVVRPGAEFVLPVPAFALGEEGPAVWKTLHLVGMTSLPDGWPIGGVYGETLAECCLRFRDGTERSLPLRNGLEITTATRWYGPSRIDPRAAFAPRAVEFQNHSDRELYIANLLSLPIENDAPLSAVTLRSLPASGCNLLLFAATLQA